MAGVRSKESIPLELIGQILPAVSAVDVHLPPCLQKHSRFRNRHCRTDPRSLNGLAVL
jgi:hypothetical protein